MTRHRRCSGQTVTLLECLVENPREWRHGYDLAKATNLKSGTLYPILVRLADRKLLESQWEATPPAGRPPRHMYRLTSQGIAYARDELSGCGCALPALAPS